MIRPVDRPEIWIVKEDKDLSELKNAGSDQLLKILEAKAKVYQPYVLLKTYETLHISRFNSINLADRKGNSDIRDLLQLTYLNNQNDSESWQNLANDMKGTEFAKKQLAIANTHLFAKASLNDEEGKQTRLNEIETISLLMATRIQSDKVILLNGDGIALDPEKFNIKHARSIHKNIVRVHKWPFEQVNMHPSVSFYLKGDHCLALLDGKINLEIKGLKAGVTIEWSKALGVVQTYAKGGDDESCD